MNKGAFQSYLVQQQMEGGPTWWSMKNMKPPPELTFPLLPSSSSPVFPEYAQPSSTEMTPWQHSQDLPESWYQLLLEGSWEKKKSMVRHLSKRKRWRYVQISPIRYRTHQLLHKSLMSSECPLEMEMCIAVGAKRSRSLDLHGVGFYRHHLLDPVSLPVSAPTCWTSQTTQVADQRIHQSTETAPASKKVRVQGSSSPKSILKVRKEKLGDRITALHQLVSPFGKTDTASVLQEAIGYIRFLQCQIEALSSPYLSSGSGNMRLPAQGNMSCLFSEDPGQSSNGSGKNKSGPQDQERNDEAKKDLRSRGLCLVPVSFTMHVGSDDGAGFWAPTLGGGF